MDAAETTAPVETDVTPENGVPAPPVGRKGREPVLVEPDLEFIRVMGLTGGDSLKKCFQCGT